MIKYDTRIDSDLAVSYPAHRLYLELTDNPRAASLAVRALGHACRLSDQEVEDALAELRTRGYLPRKDSEATLAAARDDAVK